MILEMFKQNSKSYNKPENFTICLTMRYDNIMRNETYIYYMKDG